MMKNDLQLFFQKHYSQYSVTFGSIIVKKNNPVRLLSPVLHVVVKCTNSLILQNETNANFPKSCQHLSVQ